MDSDIIQPCSLSPIKNHHHQFIVELDALCRALTVLEDFILEQTEQKQEHDKEHSLYQKVVSYFENCLARFLDLRSEENSYEFGEELARDVSEAFEHITEMLIQIEEKITTSDSNSHKNARFKDFAATNSNQRQDSTEGNSTGSSWYETILEGMMMGKKMQTRFDFIRKRGLSRETVAGFRDMHLGTKGRSVIRFDLGRKSGQPHINIDPVGLVNRKNPHINVPASVVAAAPYVQKSLKFLGSALTVFSIAADSYRMYCAGKEDYDKKFQDVEDIKRLEGEIVLIRAFLEKKENFLKEKHSLNNYALLKEKDLLKEKHLMNEYVLLEKYVLLNDSLKEDDSLKEYVLLNKEEFLKEEILVKNSLKEYVLLKKNDLLKEEDLFENLDTLKEKDSLKDYVLLKKEDLSKEYFFLKKQDLIKEDSRMKDSLIEDSTIVKSLKYAILEYELSIQVIKNGQNVPVKSIKTGSTIAGGLAGATVVGSLGATYGAAAFGAVVGFVFGPLWIMVGAFVGAISGAFGGGIWGGMKGSAAGELVAEKTLQKVLGQIDMNTHEEEESKLKDCEKKRL